VSLFAWPSIVGAGATAPVSWGEGVHSDQQESHRLVEVVRVFYGMVEANAARVVLRKPWWIYP
jgi:hypothetical protein